MRGSICQTCVSGSFSTVSWLSLHLSCVSSSDLTEAQGSNPRCPNFTKMCQWSSGYDGSLTQIRPKVQILVGTNTCMNGWSSGMTQHYAYAGTDVQFISRSLLRSEERNKYQRGLLGQVRSLYTSHGLKQSCHSCFSLSKEHTDTYWPTSTPVSSREAHNGSWKLSHPILPHSTATTVTTTALGVHKPLSTCWSTSTPVHSRETYNEGRKLVTKWSYNGIQQLPSSDLDKVHNAKIQTPSSYDVSRSSLNEGGGSYHLPCLGT